MARRLIATTSIVSLILCVGVVAVCGLSYRFGLYAQLYGGDRFVVLCAWNGRIGGCYEFRPGQVGSLHLRWGTYQPRPDEDETIEKYVPRVFNIAGFDGWRGPFMGGSRSTCVIPAWSVIVALLALPVDWIRRERGRARSLKSGTCSECHYNLTGNTSGVCPECGTPVPKEAADNGPRPA